MATSEEQTQLNKERYMPDLSNYEMTTPEGIANFCADSNAKLVQYGNATRMVVVPVITFKVVAIKATDFEAFANASINDKIDYDRRHKEYRRKLGTTEEISFPDLNPE